MGVRFGSARLARCDRLSKHASIGPNRSINPRSVRAFLITRSARGGGGGDTTPWRFQTENRSASQQRPVARSRRELANGDIKFDHSIGQYVTCRTFPTCKADIGKTMTASDLELLRACSPGNSLQDNIHF